MSRSTSGITRAAILGDARGSWTQRQEPLIRDRPLRPNAVRNGGDAVVSFGGLRLGQPGVVADRLGIIRSVQLSDACTRDPSYRLYPGRLLPDGPSLSPCLLPLPTAQPDFRELTY
jgi:hypothetical protein